ncbi:MAG: hypothetical protein ACXVYY_01175 [Oryzihumus sp.]
MADSDSVELTSIPATINAYRGADGVMVVHVDTSPDLTEASGDADGYGVPRLRVYVNDDPVWQNPPYSGDGP